MFGGISMEELRSSTEYKEWRDKMSEKFERPCTVAVWGKEGKMLCLECEGNMKADYTGTFVCDSCGRTAVFC